MEYSSLGSNLSKDNYGSNLSQIQRMAKVSMNSLYDSNVFSDGLESQTDSHVIDEEMMMVN